MKLPRPYTLAEISRLIACKYTGPDDHIITGLNEIHMVEPGDIVFVDHPKYYDKALASKADTVIINKEVEAPAGKALIFSEQPFDTYNELVKHFSPDQTWNAQAEAKIDPSALIAPGVALGRNVSIGKNTVIHPNVVIYDNTHIGENVTIHANTVIGSHAFYYKKKPTGYDKMRSSGSVIIEDGVEIGASCTIDKGVSGATKIGAGTKIDNLVHIGHDTVVGRNCLFAAQVGIAGCVVIEDDVTLWGQVGVRSDITIGKGAVVLAQTGISKALKGEKTYFGSPVGESREKLLELANVRKIPSILAELKDLRKECEK